MADTLSVESGPTGANIFQPPSELASRAHISSFEQYKEMYKRSIEDPDGFWAEVAEDFYWQKKWDKVREFDFKDKISIKYFIGAKTNVTYNALDRHLEKRGDQIAILWEGNEPGEDGKLTYRELHAEVCKFANVLKSRGVKKGDRVSIYMPMVKELAIAMLACARSDCRLDLRSDRYDRWRVSRCQGRAAQGQRRRGHGNLCQARGERQDLHRLPARRSGENQDRHEARPGLLVARPDEERVPGV